MPFDLTKKIKLDEKNHRRYRNIQITFYAFFFALLVYLAYLIFFPTQEFNFSFVSPNKGNVINPRDEKGTPIVKGKFTAGQKNYFDASLVGNFSEIKISFTPEKKSIRPENQQINLRKSYKAFLSPKGVPVGFKNGTLLKSGLEYYLISEKKLRKFDDLATISALGFSQDAFISIDDSSELKHNLPGELITKNSAYPADALFRIADNYYQLDANGNLRKFISPKAFSSHYPEKLAITKDMDFLSVFPVANEAIGLADGTLVSYGLSAYIVSGNKIYPIGDPDIFLNQGYVWNDLIMIDGAEFSFYEKQKLFTLTSAHPDGTIFFTPDSQKWYLVENGQKHELPSKKIADSWLNKKNPLTVSEKSLDVLGSCFLKKELFGNYSCLIPLNDKEEAAGKYYEFTFTAKEDLKLNNLNLLYEKNMTAQNFKLALRGMILKIKARYGIQSTPKTQ